MISVVILVITAVWEVLISDHFLVLQKLLRKPNISSSLLEGFFDFRPDYCPQGLIFLPVFWKVSSILGRTTVHKTCSGYFQLFRRFSSLFQWLFHRFQILCNRNILLFFSDLESSFMWWFWPLSLESFFKIFLGFGVSFKSLLNLKYYLSA